MADVTAAAGVVTVNAVGAVIISILGIEPQAMVWAMVGSTLGLSLAKPAGKVRATLLFVAASLACALLGTLAAVRWFDGSAMVRNTLTLAMAIGFHPALSSYLEKVPKLFSAIWERIFPSRSKP